jgi:hypothetical protein
MLVTTEQRDRIADSPAHRSRFMNKLIYLTNILYLLFGGSFFGIVLLLVAGQINGSASDYIAVAGGMGIAAAFGRRSAKVFVAAYIGATVGGLVALAALQGLAALASSGTYAADKSEWHYVNTENYLVFGVLWLLLGVPHRAFKYQLDQEGEGKAQHTLTGSLTVGASILTGVSISLLHFDRGPLRDLSAGPLLAGIIFTVFLIQPGYRSLATACWNRGILKIVRPKLTVKNWSETATELDTALQQYFEKRSAMNLIPEKRSKIIIDPQREVSKKSDASAPVKSTSAEDKISDDGGTRRDAPERSPKEKNSSTRRSSKRSRNKRNAHRR